MNTLESASSSRQSSSSPGGSPSRSSTPSQSSSSSDFLPSDAAPLTPWTPYAKSESVGLFDEDQKPPFDAYYSFGMSNAAPFQTSPSHGMLLEDLMQEDAYETAPFDNLLQRATAPTLITSFDPSLPSLPPYPSPSSSSSESPSQPTTVQLAPSQGTVRQVPRSRLPIASDERNAFESSSLQNFLVTVPNATCPNAPILTPNRHTVANLPILIHNVPAVGAKSRVETQIKMTLDLAAPRDAMSAYDRIGSWKWLRLPKGTSTRRRPRKEPKIDAHPDDTLTLSVAVTCASDPSMPVSACTNCLQREAKRIERKKAARVRPQRHDSSDSEDEGAVFRVPTGADGKALPPKEGEGTGIVVFNCPEVNDFSEGRVVLPVRVTCYCRHHREKMGFRIAFTMADSQGRVVGRGSTPPIMITDDHKSVVKTTPPAPPPEEEEPQQPKRNKRRLGTKDADPVEIEREPRAKRRAKEPTPPTSIPSTSASTPQASGTSFFPQQYHQRFDSSPRFASTSAHASQSPSTFTTAPSSPLLSALNAPSPAPSGVFLHYPVTNDSQIQQQQPPKGILNDTYMQSEEVDALSSTLAAAVSASPVVPDLSQTSASSIFSALAFGTGQPEGPPGPTPPTIHRLIPASGPTHGGIEVTVLGANFLPSHRVVFGDTVAASTQMWSESTLVCLLPPSATPGPVVVSFEGIPLAVGGVTGGGGADGRGLQLFNYLDNSDRALMELALQVVGLKMTGRIEEAKDVAMRIVGTSSPNGGSDAALTPGGMSTLSGLTGVVDEDVVHSALHGQGSDGQSGVGSSTRDFQSVIIEFLKLLDVEVPTRSNVTIQEAISFTSSSGQTLLHLSAILGFHRLLKHLVTRGIDLDVRDANGYTALHFAALCGRVACARILVEGGADIEIVDARGRLAREVAQWRDQIDVQELLESYENRAVRAGGLGSRDQSDDADESEVDDANETDFQDAEDVDEWDVASPTITIKPAPTDVPEVLNLSDSELDDAEDGQDNNDDLGLVKPLIPPEDSKPLSEKSLLDLPEKNPQSLFHRTLSQLPTPGLPTFPPMPDIFPNMPGLLMPQWGLPNQLQFPQLHLPEIPLVFPVQVPTPSWPTALQWSGSTPEGAQKRPDGAFAVPPSAPSPSWLSLYPAWFAASPPAEKEQDPPMYTPSPSASQAHISAPPATAAPLATPAPSQEEVALPAGSEVESGSTTPTARTSSSSLRTKLTRRQAHAAERDYRVVKKKQQYDKSKSDRMLFFFWIPILIVFCLYGAYVGVPVIITGVRNAASQYLTLRKQLTA